MDELVLIPGLACDARIWRSQVAALAPWRPSVSDVNTRAATIAGMAELLLGQHPGRLVLCGASMGAMVAMEAARQAPQRVAALALLGTDARADAPDMTALREAAIALFEQDRVREVVEPNVAFAFHADHAAALAPAYLEIVLAAGAQQLIRQNRAVIARADARQWLPSVRCPTLVLCGEDDRLTPLERSQEIAALVPGARLEVVPRCGHMLTMERPEVVNAVLGEWLGTTFDASRTP